MIPKPPEGGRTRWTLGKRLANVQVQVLRGGTWGAFHPEETGLFCLLGQSRSGTEFGERENAGRIHRKGETSMSNSSGKRQPVWGSNRAAGGLGSGKR